MMNGLISCDGNDGMMEVSRKVRSESSQVNRVTLGRVSVTGSAHIIPCEVKSGLGLLSRLQRPNTVFI